MKFDPKLLNAIIIYLIDKFTVKSILWIHLFILKKKKKKSNILMVPDVDSTV